jgi:two-component system cell cycle sensor histidine kinase/response regulator CckA
MSYTPKILIVDDEPRMCISLKMLLSHYGYEIHTSNGGKEAVEYLSKNNFDLVLLDMVMPDMGGRQVMDYIKGQSPETLIIVITGHASVESAVAALRHGVYDYLRKPFEHEELLKTVENAIEQKRLNGERKRAEAALRESARRLQVAYEQSIIYAQQLNEEMTERKRTAEALARAKEDWENTFDAITDMVMLLDNEHQVFRVNRAAAEALNTTKERLLGKKCYEAVHGQSHPIRRCPLVLTMKTLEPHTTEITEPRLGGTFICSTSPILDRQGKLTGYTHTLKDITKWKRLEAQFQQAQKMEAIGTLAGGIAHDFNNLLMGTQGNISLMLLDIDSSHPHYERLKSIERQIQSGAKLTRLLLGYARKGKYEVKPVDLNQLVGETSETFGRTRKEITIHQELAEDLFAIEADRAQIEQVLLNLFVNAGDAMSSGGDLILKTMNTTHDDMKGELYDPKPGDYVLLTVTDTGIGMDKETVERIFDPFFTTKEMGRGTGLGLASAYGIIKGHGGYIEVDSKKGQGATFRIYLPASGKKVQKTVKTADQLIKGTGTVLLVDDEEVILEVGKELLEGMGYRVLTAKDGKKAVEAYKKNRDEIDIVLLDMVMPNMGGGEAYDRMKEINPDIKALLSSGFSIDGEASEILERGCNGFIQKPFSMKELSGRIMDILEKK